MHALRTVIMKALITSIALAGAALTAQAGLPLRAYGHMLVEQGPKLGDQLQPTGAHGNSPQGKGDDSAAGIGGISGEDTFPRNLANGEQAVAGGTAGIGREDIPGAPRKMDPSY
jgi:hypothetical protein